MKNLKLVINSLWVISVCWLISDIINCLQGKYYNYISVYVFSFVSIVNGFIYFAKK